MPVGQLKEAGFSRDAVDSLRVRMMVKASLDPSCLGRKKYVYRFESSIQASIAQAFSDCETTALRFSKMIPGAHDLLKINKTDEFQADIVVGGLSATAYFVARDATALMRSIEAFDHRLCAAGYGPVTYLTIQSSHCDRCPVSHLKQCSGHTQK